MRFFIGVLIALSPSLIQASAQESTRQGEQGTANQSTGLVDVVGLVEETADILNKLEGYIPLVEKEALLNQVKSNLDILLLEAPEEPRLAYFEGRLLAAAGRPREAVSKLQRFVETREGRNDWRTFRLMGDLLVEQYPRLAKSHYVKAEQLHEGDVDVKYGLARVAAQTGERDEAISVGRELVLLGGEKQRLYLAFLSKVLMLDSQWDEAAKVAAQAVEIFRAATQEHSDVMEPYLGIDSMLAVQIQAIRARIALIEPAASDFQELSRLVTEKAQNRYQINLFEVGRVYEEGLERLGDAAPLSLFMSYGKHLVDVGRKDAARLIYQRVLDKEPNHAGATAAMAALGG